MNIICSTIEATTAMTQLIGTCIGALSVIWSHCSGIYHMVAGPLLGGGCGTLLALCQDTLGGLVGSPIGQSISQFIAGLGVK